MLKNPVDVFISYSHADDALRRELEIHLALLKRQGFLRVWHDHEIQAGQPWRGEIDERLEHAALILLLISPDFLASDFCYDVEMTRALERHNARETLVVPVILRPSDWRSAPFGRLKATPRDGKPVTSWKDRDAAFLDVVRSLRKALESRHGAPRGRPFLVPFRRNPYFTGRERILRRLRATLSEKRAAALGQAAAISGLGGIGKTQTALEYVWRYRDDYRAVFFLRSETESELRSGFGEVARELGMREADIADQDVVVAAVRRWLAVEDGWLLVLDNADDPALVQPFLPQSPRGHVLLTSRSQVFHQVGIRHPFRMAALPSSEAVDFLLGRVERETISGEERRAAAVLAEELGCLPLALEQAGAYILEQQLRFVDYLQAYRRRGIEVLGRGRPVVEGHPRPVETTWSLNFQEVEETAPAAADVLRASAFLAPDDIPEEILTQATVELGPAVTDALGKDDPLALGGLLAPLSRYSLIQRDLDARTWSLHRLVQEVVKANLTDEDKLRWSERVIRALERVFPWPEFSAWPVCERLLPHGLAALSSPAAKRLETIEAGSLVNSIADYLHRRAHFHDAEPLFVRSLRITRKALGDEHPTVATALNNLAELYRNQGRLEEARPLFEQSLRIRRSALGDEHPAVATSLNNLALLHWQQGRLAEAETLYGQALGNLEKAFGEEDPSVAATLNNLAIVYRAQGRLPEAERLYERSLRIREDTLGKEHPEVASSLNNLALLYQAQRRFAEAEPLYSRALRSLEKALGDEHPDVAQALENYAGLLCDTDRADEAAEMELRARHIRDSHALQNVH